MVPGEAKAGAAATGPETLAGMPHGKLLRARKAAGEAVAQGPRLRPARRVKIEPVTVKKKRYRVQVRQEQLEGRANALDGSSPKPALAS